MGRTSESLTLINKMSHEMRSDLSTYSVPNVSHYLWLQIQDTKFQMHLLVGLYCVASGEVDQAIRHLQKNNSSVALSTIALLRKQIPGKTKNLNLVDQAIVNISRGLMAFVNKDYDGAK